ATLANMGPEYGATMGYCPVDEKTIDYLRITGRDESLVRLAESYCRAQGLWYDEDPQYSDVLELDLSQVVPCLAGHRRPQDRIPLPEIEQRFHAVLHDAGLPVNDGHGFGNGSVVIASITSCTNTANPSVMLGAALLARKAIGYGLRPKEWVKTSLSPGSKVVTEYLERAGLMSDLEALGFHNTGYGCMTCIGNSGPLDEALVKRMKDENLITAAVVSANRNFEGRVSPHVKANYLASPALVIAFSLCGRVDIDLEKEPLGADQNGEPVYLRDIWPDENEINSLMDELIGPELFREKYADVFQGSKLWDEIDVPEGDLFQWDDGSTYIRNPPFFDDLVCQVKGIEDLDGARALAFLGDSITTDHISPAGSFNENSDAGRYLVSRGVMKNDFNSYGSRRGNHEVMMRGTFANIRLKNTLADGKEGGWSKKLPEGTLGTIFQTSQSYIQDDTPLIVLAGKEYGTGSSRDWAAKGPYLLGVKAVIAESFERIHRSNLIGMGVVPLQYRPGENAKTLGLDGKEVYHIQLSGMRPRGEVKVRATGQDGKAVDFQVVSRVDTDVELEYVSNGGILQTVLRNMMD
ncbi:MAG: aconitate hydratase AcnA, partial [Candidatus Methanomethylophilaceae archaeon]|nr:aconitate hydratase AcnA [Candidatus Methanomethylophilaceae archaeon]